MRRNIPVALAASLAVLAVNAGPLAAATVSAQEADMAEPDMAEPAQPSEKDEVAMWPVEKQAAYKAWPDETKAYYWTLSDKRQKLFWGLSDADKVTLSQMAAPDQAKAWARIEQSDGGTEARR